MKNWNMNTCVPAIQQNSDLYDRVCAVLRELGVPAHLKGHAYLAEAVILTLQHPDYLRHMMEQLYPAVARKCHTTPACAERAMRHAVETAWLRADPDTLTCFFGNTVSPRKGKPVNAEFIAQISSVLRQEVAA